MTEPPLIRRLEDETALREAEAGGPLVPPPNLGRRVRARQALIVLVAAAVMIAVVGATIVAVSGAIRRQAPSAEPTMTGPEGHRTAYVDGVRLSYPRRWSLLQLPGAGNPAPLLQLTNFRPHSAAGLGCGGGGTSIPARGVLLVVGQVRPPLAGLPRWPVSMVPRGRGCFAARWSVRGVAMEAFMIVGSRARLLARRDMLESFHSMRFPAELRPGLTSPREVAGGAGPMFVVASGYLAGRPSSYLARATDGGVCLANVVGSGPATGPCPAIQAAGSIEVLRTGPWAAVIGVVSRRARSVQAELAAGETVAGEIVRPPPLLHAPFNFYSIELPLQSRGDVVAFDGAGGTLGRRSFDPPSLPVLKRGGVPGQRWVLLDREQANGVRCIDFDAGHGDHATFCPDAVPASRDLQATLMTTPSGRRIVVGVASARVAYVRVGFLTPKYVPCRLLPFPRAFHGPGAVLPPMYNLFVGSLASIDGAVIEGYDRRWNPVDGMPLGTGGGFGT